MIPSFVRDTIERHIADLEAQIAPVANQIRELRAYLDEQPAQQRLPMPTAPKPAIDLSGLTVEEMGASLGYTSEYPGDYPEHMRGLRRWRDGGGIVVERSLNHPFRWSSWPDGESFDGSDYNHPSERDAMERLYRLAVDGGRPLRPIPSLMQPAALKPPRTTRAPMSKVGNNPRPQRIRAGTETTEHYFPRGSYSSIAFRLGFGTHDATGVWLTVNEWTRAKGENYRTKKVR